MIAHPHSSSAIHHHGEQGRSTAPFLHRIISHPLSSPQLPAPRPRFLPSSHPHSCPFSLDTIVYAASGHGTILTNPSLLGPSNLKRYDLSPGDFALIPAWTEHQEVNSSDKDVVWIITGNGSTPVVVNLEDWGGGLSGL
jgi:hypothetical protein